MYERKENNEEQNFWVSYADLMAGLLFVFILVLGAIVIKYVYVQTNLEDIKNNLLNEKDALKQTSQALKKTNNALNLSNKALQQKRIAFLDISEKLKKSNEESLHLSFELAKAQNLYSKTQENLSKSKELSKKLSLNLNDKNQQLQLSNEQIDKITKILEDKQNNIRLLDTTIKEQKQQLDDANRSLKFSLDEIAKLKDILLGYELREKTSLEEKTNLSNKIDEQVNIIKLKDNELEELANAIIIQSKVHQKLVEEFDITKVKIKNLTGIRIKVITALKEKLGDSIDIDHKSGSIKFSSNILFDQGKFLLKEGSKKELSQILKKYIHTLLLDKNIRQYIESITIQGHTNSDGTYLYNLELSQKRALEVMKFLYSLDIKNKYLLEKYISASGRSYSDRIKDKNGFEEKDASRRIEIKFRIKNEEAIKELSNYLEKQK